MAVNFPSNPSDGDTVLTGTKLYTYHASKGVWKDSDGDDVTQSTLDNYLEVANSSSIGVTTYSALSDLPLSGQSTGKMAYVSGTNRLYLWAGSGWYNIALVNTDPSISGASSTYNLDSDGANTVVTLASSDPEGLPISFSLSTSGLGVGANAIATVTQSNNIFTFTPTTNTALAGTFTATFTASDGVNVAVANSSFTLAFTVNNSNYTTALITSVGTNNQVNNDFVDSSTNSHTITASGDVTQTTFSPHRHGGYSTYFDGSGDYLISDTNFTAIGTDDFTIEFWYNGGAQPARYPCIIGTLDAFSATGAWRVMTYNDNSNTFMFGFETTAYTFNTENYNDGVWRHFAVTREGTNLKGFVNGVQQGSTLTMGSNLTSRQILVAGQLRDNGFQEGYISDVRVIKGTALYTSNFTPPTERLTAITNTSLLTCHLPYIADGSTNGYSFTVNGDTKPEPFSPYDYETYSATDNGGSMYFDGTNDYLNIAYDATIADWSSTDYTIEAWVNYNSFNVSGTGGKPLIIKHGIVGTTTDYWSFGASSTGALYFYYYNGSAITSCISTATLNLNTWHHIVMSHNNTDNEITLYLDGVSVKTHTVSGTPQYNSGSTIIIGEAQGTEHDGHITDLRITTSEVYSADFTPPTAPLTAITNTQLLLSGTNAGIIDKSQSVQTLTLNGNVKSSTSQTKYLTSSMYFDGTGDYIEISDTTFNSTLAPTGTVDFTMEAWININAHKSYNYIYSQGYPIQLVTTSAGLIELYFNDTDNNSSYFTCHQTTGSALSTGTWYHLAATREGSNFRLFLDGVEVGSLTSSSSIAVTSSNPRIGDWALGGYSMNGYVEDFRITKGIARYTSDFTPPTSALLG